VLGDRSRRRVQRVRTGVSSAEWARRGLLTGDEKVYEAHASTTHRLLIPSPRLLSTSNHCTRCLDTLDSRRARSQRHTLRKTCNTMTDTNLSPLPVLVGPTLRRGRRGTRRAMRGWRTRRESVRPSASCCSRWVRHHLFRVVPARWPFTTILLWVFLVSGLEVLMFRLLHPPLRRAPVSISVP
jgi:hypothetical protein